MYHFQFLLINYFFPATRRKSKLFQTGSRSSYYRSSVISLRGWATSRVCGERGGQSPWAESPGGCPGLRCWPERSPTSCPRIWGGMGRGQLRLCQWHLFEHNQRRRSPYTHPPPGLPAPAALSSALCTVRGWDQLCSITQSCCVPFCTSQPTLSTQTSRFFKNHDGAKTN